MPKPTPFVTTPKKSKIQKLPNFLNIQTGRLAAYQGLNSSLAQSPGKLWSCKVTQTTWVTCDFQVQIFCTLAPKVLIDVK